MNTSIKVDVFHPNLDAMKSIDGETIPFIESKFIEGDMGIDSHGRMIFRSDHKINDRRFVTPFKDVEFVTINKEDAQNLYDMLTWAMDQIKPGEMQYKDIDVFGDRAISYERLYDYLNGEDYHIRNYGESGS